MSIEDYNTDAIDLAFDHLETYNSSGVGGSNETKESPNKCYITDEIDDFSIESVAPGEVCTIEMAQSYGIFGKDEYFNSLLRERNDINTFSDNSEENLTYSLCSIIEDKTYANCALSTKNPWKSLNQDGEYCMLPIDIPLPKGLTYNDDSTMINKPPDIPYTLSSQDICKHRWYDWFSIPDYHLGNMYSSNENTGKCMKPCEIETIPDDDNDDKCINRESYARGFFKSDFYYIPLALVLLLGSTKETLLRKHKKELVKYRSYMKGISMDYEIYNSIMSDETTQNNIYESIKADLRHHIKEFLNKPFDDTYILVPSKQIQNLNSVKTMMSKENLLEAYDIAAKYFVLSVNKDNEDDFEKWKKELADINGYNVTDDKFYKQLLILKKACNILFNNKSSYSRDNVLYNINIDLKPGEAVKQSIEFEITETDSIMAISKNSAEVDVKKIGDMDDILKRRKEILSKGTGNENLETGDEITQIDEEDEIRTTLAIPGTISSSKSNTSSTLAQIIAVTAVVLFVIFIIMIVLILGNFFWYYIAEFLNMLIISFAYLIYGIRDLFRMKWTPSALNIEISELQKSFVDKKIMTDLSRFK
jgi:hypothetical protein